MVNKKKIEFPTNLPTNYLSLNYQQMYPSVRSSIEAEIVLAVNKVIN